MRGRWWDVCISGRERWWRQRCRWTAAIRGWRGKEDSSEERRIETQRKARQVIVSKKRPQGSSRDGVEYLGVAERRIEGVWREMWRSDGEGTRHGSPEAEMASPGVSPEKTIGRDVKEDWNVRVAAAAGLTNVALCKRTTMTVLGKLVLRG